MTTVCFFEDVTMYQFMTFEDGTASHVLHTKVIIDDTVYNCYQFVRGIIVLNTKTLGTLHDVERIIPLKEHLDLLDMSIRRGTYYCVRLHGRNLEKGDYKLVDITRNLKLKKITNKLSI